MDKFATEEKRKSHFDKGEIYFWTATINKWQKLLYRDEYKDVIISSLQYLSDSGKIDVFGFVIMPTHIHFIWRVNGPNGKESAHGSFLKYTAHIFRRMLLKVGKQRLTSYKVELSNKQHEFWKRDSLAVPVFTRKFALQKLNYIHKNPLMGRWKLARLPREYKYSSAGFYERGLKDFPFLKNLWVEV